MILITTALLCEAKPIIQHYSLKEIQKTPFSIFSNDVIKLIVSRPGCFKAAAAVGYLAGKVNRAEKTCWLNIGLAGHSEAEIGDLFWVSKISKENQQKSFYPYFPRPLNLKKLQLMTLDALSQNYQNEFLFDMEGYGFFSAALHFASLEQVQVLKVISDGPQTLLNDITPQKAESLIKNQMREISFFIEEMLELELPTLKKQRNLSSILERWHLTETEKTQAAKRIAILKLHKIEVPLLEQMPSLRTKKDFLALLEDLVFNITVSYD